MSAPVTPSNLYVQQANGQVYLSWDISAGATSYPVYRSTDNVSFSLLSSPSTAYYLDTAVTVGTQYFYKITASNGTASPYTSAQGVVPTYSGDVSLGQLRLMAQQRADRVNSNFVTLPEWNSYITQSAFELYDILVSAFEEYYLAPAYQLTTDGSSAQYSLPDGSSTFLDVDGATAKPFYKLLGVDVGLTASNNARVTLHKFDFIERNRYVYPNITSTMLGVFNMRYRLMGNKLYFIPTPSGGQICTVWYIPRMVQPLKDNDILYGVSGWTEYIIVDAAIKALQKQECDVSVLMAEKAALLHRIESAAMNRDAGQPDTISASRGGDSFGPNGDGSYGGR